MPGGHGHPREVHCCRGSDRLGAVWPRSAGGGASGRRERRRDAATEKEAFFRSTAGARPAEQLATLISLEDLTPCCNHLWNPPISTVLAHYWQQLGHTYNPDEPDHVVAANAINAITGITGGTSASSNDS